MLQQWPLAKAGVFVDPWIKQKAQLSQRNRATLRNSWNFFIFKLYLYSVCQ